jgi:hypothetical protein
MSEWISVDEQLPKLGEMVLASVAVGSVMGRSSMVFISGMMPSAHGAEKEWQMESIPKIYTPLRVTHWMPLPSPPEDSE